MQVFEVGDLSFMKRFLPYYRYLLEVKWFFIGAVLTGLLYGAVSGAGLPLMLKKVLPEIFNQENRPFWDLLKVAILFPLYF